MSKGRKMKLAALGLIIIGVISDILTQWTEGFTFVCASLMVPVLLLKLTDFED